MKRRNGVGRNGRLSDTGAIPYISPGVPEHIDDLVLSSSQVRRRPLTLREGQAALDAVRDELNVGPIPGRPGMVGPRRRAVSPAGLSMPPPSGVPHVGLSGARAPIAKPTRKYAPRRRVGSPTSTAQREKKATGCRLHGAACGTTDACHVTDRSIGGCDDALCTIPLCRPVHEAFDAHEFDALPLLTYEEQAHAVGHLGILRALRRITGSEWVEKLGPEVRL